MLKWLDADLRKASHRFFKVVYFHHPPYGFGPNEADELTALAREHIVPIVERHGVQLVINGHEHSYQRSHSIRGGEIVEQNRGTTYITTGGGGNGLYPVHEHRLVTRGHSVHHYLRVRAETGKATVEAVDLRGRVFDTVTLAPLPETGPDAVRSLNATPGRHAAGGVISIYGSSLGRRAQAADAANPVTELAGVSIDAGDQPARLLYASPSQVNALLPEGLDGEVALRVRNLNGETALSLRVSPSAPGIVAVAHEDGSLVTAAAPARRGERVMVYAAGLGRAAVTLELDGVVVACEAGEGPFPGVGRVAFRVPEVVGKRALRVRAGEAASPPVIVEVAP
jgi:uncharacterized protein (TIGR03437 family)